MKRWGKKAQRVRKNISMENDQSLQNLFQSLNASDDFAQYPYSADDIKVVIAYYTTLIDSSILHKDIIPYMRHASKLSDLQYVLPFEHVKITSDERVIQDSLATGSILIFHPHDLDEVCIVHAATDNTRQVSIPEVEFSVVGPKESFVEDYDTNLYLIRKRLPIPELIVKEIRVGKLSKTKIAVLYIKGIANEENAATVIQRISDIQTDQIMDSSYLTQLIQDNQHSPFPQLIDTERPDRVASVLGEGKVVIVTDGAPHVLIGPTTIFEFFSAFEDYYLNWLIASFFRIVRFFAVLFSILVTPIYVAVITYHYELIPKDMVSTLVTSRTAIPLPPILEALILELAIELLREAGARLPTKVGQTIGIVGGIVIGTASVEAGLTSNVLLIIVALAALASFTTPVYQMGNTIRLIRFPFLLMAHYIGLLGVAISFCYLILHLLKLSSLGRPFLEPFYPLRVSDLKDALIRLPFPYQAKRPIQEQPVDQYRFDPTKAKVNNDPKRD